MPILGWIALMAIFSSGFWLTDKMLAEQFDWDHYIHV